MSCSTTRRTLDAHKPDSLSQSACIAWTSTFRRCHLAAERLGAVTVGFENYA